MGFHFKKKGKKDTELAHGEELSQVGHLRWLIRRKSLLDGSSRASSINNHLATLVSSRILEAKQMNDPFHRKRDKKKRRKNEMRKK